jgi:AAA domain/Primase C terminal 1 (PriCT-1)
MGNVSIHDDQQRELLSARVNNRYVVAAGSWAYPNNDTTKPLTQYTAINPNAPFIEAPSSLIAFIKTKDAEYKTKKSSQPKSSDESRLYHEGGRNNALTRKAGALRNAGANPEMILQKLQEWNQELCVPPLPDSEVESIAKSIARYPEGRDHGLDFSQQSEIAQPQPAQPVDVSNWQSLFRSVGEMEDGPIDMIIEGALQEGTCFLGATAGDGKTLIALAFAKAISTGTPLFNLQQFSVKKPRPVIYLIPESRDRAFRKRCEAFRIPDDKTKFMTRTISAGVPLELSDPRLLEAVKQTKAVVILDTASRFMKGNDENAAAQNRFLVNDVLALTAAGAVCVILIHHATKAAKQNQEQMTLENMLRGTGDFAAMCDQAYGARKDMTLYANGAGPVEIDFVNLKDREQIGGLASLRLAASFKPPKRTFEDGAIHEHITFVTSYIDTTGNFRVVSDSETANREVQALETLVKNEPNISAEDAAGKLNTTKYRIKNQLEKLGYHRVKGGPDGASPWHRDVDGKCPFEKADVVEIKPVKKTYNLSVTDAAKKLEAYLVEEGPVTRVDVHKWADKEGIPDTILTKAKKRVNVLVDKDSGTWSLPAADPAMAF